MKDFVVLGRSGLRVSRLCLGTMTFGTEWGWGSAENAAQQIYDRYFELGGNFVDTADLYTGGSSEEFIGRFLKSRGDRDRAVIATKFSFNAQPDNPNAGGNGRKNILRAVEGSLRRLQTDYIDLYWLHSWDSITPAHEVLATIESLVASGKVRYFGLSNVPAWYLGQIQTIADLRGWERVCALQMEYSLAERNLEFEFVPAAMQFGIGLVPWSPLASGLLTGKYQRSHDALPGEGQGRLQAMKETSNPGFRKLFQDRNWAIADEVVKAAKEIGRSPAQIALNWVANRPAVASVILGATKLPQLDDNMGALDFTIPAELRTRLDQISEPETHYPYHFFGSMMQAMVHGENMPRRTATV